MRTLIKKLTYQIKSFFRTDMFLCFYITNTHKPLSLIRFAPSNGTSEITSGRAARPTQPVARPRAYETNVPTQSHAYHPSSSLITSDRIITDKWRMCSESVVLVGSKKVWIKNFFVSIIFLLVYFCFDF